MGGATHLYAIAEGAKPGQPAAARLVAREERAIEVLRVLRTREHHAAARRHRTDEHHQRHGILLGDVDAGRGVGGSRPARDHDHARAARQAGSNRAHLASNLRIASLKLDQQDIEGIAKRVVEVIKREPNVLRFEAAPARARRDRGGPRHGRRGAAP